MKFKPMPKLEVEYFGCAVTIPFVETSLFGSIRDWYIATDEGGLVCAYADKPKRNGDRWWVESTTKFKTTTEFIVLGTFEGELSFDWRKSLKQVKDLI